MKWLKIGIGPRGRLAVKKCNFNSRFVPLFQESNTLRSTYFVINSTGKSSILL
jgi:hypothetical protein